jgi:hypothetical protein
MENKKNRSKNLSEDERLTIIAFVKDNAKILENKGNDPNVHKKKKLMDGLAKNYN